MSSKNGYPGYHKRHVKFAKSYKNPPPSPVLERSFGGFTNLPPLPPFEKHPSLHKNKTPFDDLLSFFSERSKHTHSLSSINDIVTLTRSHVRSNLNLPPPPQPRPYSSLP